MRLYHFTAAHLVDAIIVEGLTRGCIPTIEQGVLRLVTGYQWLTENAGFAQSWTDQPGSTLPYSRTAYRLTIDVPKLRSRNLIRWLPNARRLSSLNRDLNAHGDPENWLLYRGKVPPQWIKAAEQNPWSKAA